MSEDQEYHGKHSQRGQLVVVNSVHCSKMRCYVLTHAGPLFCSLGFNLS